MNPTLAELALGHITRDDYIEKGAIKDGKTLCSVLLYARRIAKKRK